MKNSAFKQEQLSYPYYNCHLRLFLTFSKALQKLIEYPWGVNVSKITSTLRRVSITEKLLYAKYTTEYEGKKP